MINFCNALIDSSDDLNKNHQNFIKSLKFSKNILLFNDILNSLNANIEIIQGFDCLSNDEYISTFKKITIKFIDEPNNVLILNTKEKYKYNYERNNEIMTIII